MSKYTISCSKEQVEKSLKLGAEEELLTAEEMIGWLEEQFFNEISIYRYSLDSSLWEFEIFDKEDKQCLGNGEFFSSRHEATLAAIDAALEYLSLRINKTW